jgi:AcrR family transcriptional regulator
MDIEALREKIIVEFLHQFSYSGPDTKLADVAKAIHISKKSIYKCFASKQEIYEKIISGTSKEILAGQAKVYHDPKMTTKEKLYAILTIKTTREMQVNMGKMFELESKEPEVYRTLLKAYENQWDYFAKLIEEGKKDGTLKSNTSAPFVIALLSSTYERLYRDDFLLQNKLTYTSAVTMLAEVVLSGIYA